MNWRKLLAAKEVNKKNNTSSFVIKYCLNPGESSKNHGSRWTYISNLSDARLVMENLMQSYIQTDRDLAATKERLAETEDSLVTENKKLREQLMLLQSQKSPQQKVGLKNRQFMLI